MLSEEIPIYRYFIELAFNGSHYHGWQIQPGSLTVQQELNRAVSLLTGRTVNLIGCGRTDAGVHASHFIAHLDLDQQISDTKELTDRMNRFLPGAIRIDRVESVTEGAHARFTAVRRTYHYLISRRKNPYMQEYSWSLHQDLDIGAMRDAAELIVGRHDFTSFSKLHTDVKTNICSVYRAEWLDLNDFLIFRIEADRFLRNMVRALIGTFIEIGKGREDVSGMVRILEARNRSEAGMSVPARGLFLTRVKYPEAVFRESVRSPFPELIQEP